MDQSMVTYKTGKNTYKIFCNELRSRYTLYKMNGNKKRKNYIICDTCSFL